MSKHECRVLVHAPALQGLGIDMWEVRDGKRTQNPDKWVSPGQFRNPDDFALKPKHVKQIVAGLSGPASTWKPPAGLYIENSKQGLGIDMWKLYREAQASTPTVSARTGQDLVHQTGDTLLEA